MKDRNLSIVTMTVAAIASGLTAFLVLDRIAGSEASPRSHAERSDARPWATIFVP